VLDPGSHTLKAGYAAYNTPADMEPSVVVPPCVYDTEAHGEAGQRDASLYHRCLHRGVVTNMEQYEALLQFVLYDQIGWPQGDEGNLLYAEPLFTSKAEREDLCQLMFEVFNVSGLFFCDQAVLSLYACGKPTGCVVDIGHGKIDITTVTDGQTNVPSARRLEYGGATQSELLRSLLQRRGCGNLSDREIEGLKERICAVASCSEEHTRLQAGATGEGGAGELFALPDGQEICVRKEGLMAGELLFAPPSELVGADVPGLAGAVYNAIVNHHEVSMRRIVYEHLMICGGGSCIAGVQDRLLAESRLLAPPSISPAAVATPDYMPKHTHRYAAWMGGAILAKVVFPQSHHMTRAEYDERGPTAMHNKCG